MNINDNPGTSASQTAMILSYMLEGNTITSHLASQLFGCDRLAARIKDIEKRLGYSPNRRRIQVKNRFGKDVYVTEYWI